MPLTISPVPIDGGQNTSADPTTYATPFVANMALGPVGENYQRDGLVDTHTTGLGTSPVIGLYQWRDWLVIVTDNRRVWAMPRGAPYTVVAISDPADTATQLAGTARPVFTEDGLPRLVIAGGNAPLQWTGAGFCSVLVTSGHTPSATHVAYLGQRLIANDVSNPTQWYWSDLGDGSHQTWQAASFDTADASPDVIVGIYANVREAYVFGEHTVQVYAVGQDPLNPFDSITTMQVGCGAPYSPVLFDGNWVWLDDKRRFVIGDGRSFKTISDDIAKTLRGFATITDCWGYREDINSEVNVVFVFPTEEREFVYDVDKQAWTERYFYGTNGPQPRPIKCYSRWDALNLNVLGSSTTGALYTLGDDVTNDLGQPLVMERITGHLDHGTSARKRSLRVRCVARRGEGGATGDSDKLELRVADDGGPWSAWELIPLGLSGDREQTMDAYFGGVFRRRRYHLRYSGVQETSILKLEEHYQELG